ncbi:hypothetical protein F5883DRAFT_562243 [Diaporthe sp. PMI_573]|nr:hypothetical protein F5883DRAFT_562243 [Diaporthaceae sp. PMI_573]
MADLPPLKSAKPRPHTCPICQGAFTRLAHLNRHKRSHTKEKPFECQACKRCFGRRDLLLRHERTLHQSGSPPAARRNCRKSAGVVIIAQSQVLMNNAAGPARTDFPNLPSMWPTANTTNVANGTAQQMLSGRVNRPVAHMPPAHGHDDSPMGRPHNHYNRHSPDISSIMGHQAMQFGFLDVETDGLTYGWNPQMAPFDVNLRTKFVNNLSGTPNIDPQSPNSGMESLGFISINPNLPVFPDFPDSTSEDAPFELEDFSVNSSQD